MIVLRLPPLCVGLWRTSRHKTAAKSFPCLFPIITAASLDASRVALFSAFDGVRLSSAKFHAVFKRLIGLLVLASTPRVPSAIPRLSLRPSSTVCGAYILPCRPRPFRYPPRKPSQLFWGKGPPTIQACPSISASTTLTGSLCLQQGPQWSWWTCWSLSRPRGSTS